MINNYKKISRKIKLRKANRTKKFNRKQTGGSTGIPRNKNLTKAEKLAAKEAAKIAKIREKAHAMAKEIDNAKKVPPRLQNVSHQNLPKGVVRTVILPEIQVKPQSAVKVIEAAIMTHFWYKAWPDMGVPDEILTMKEFVKNLMTDIKDNAGGTVIHCSAGVGRTGVMYVILRLMFKIEKTQMKITYNEILDEIEMARNNRMMLVQTFGQYYFICDFFETDRFYEDNPTTPFNIIKNYDITNMDSTKTFKKATTSANKPLNRYGNILPYDDTIVSLDNGKYINANNMEPFNDNPDYPVITTQCPINTTINDFKEMLLGKKIKRIIMLTLLEEGGRQKCNDYTDGLLQGECKSLIMQSDCTIMSAGIEKRVFNLKKYSNDELKFILI